MQIKTIMAVCVQFVLNGGSFFLIKIVVSLILYCIVEKRSGTLAYVTHNIKESIVACSWEYTLCSQNYFDYYFKKRKL